jgi:hypothetical protein
LQEELRRKHGINSNPLQRYRSEHLASKIIPREEAQSAVRLPVTEQLNDTSEVSCWKDSDHLISRLARSAVISSGAGYRANAEVEATAFRPKYQETYTGPLCQNRVKLFLAKDSKSDFQILFDSNLPKNECVTVEGKDWCGVKGIQLVDWSSDGRLLLANLVLWEYESDALLMRVPVIYDIRKSDFTRPDVYHFFDEHYEKHAKQHCALQLLTEGFSPDGNLIISASRTPLNDSYDQVFCFDGKQTFLFQLGANKISDLPAGYKVQHFGIWNSGSVLQP